MSRKYISPVQKLWMNGGEEVNRERSYGSIKASLAIIAMTLLFIVGFASGYYTDTLFSSCLLYTSDAADE